MVRLFSSAAALTLVASLGLFAGCASNGACCDATAATKPNGNVAVVNTLCPIGNDDFETKERTPDLARTHSGTAIGFCCESCVKSFDKMSDEKKAEVVKAALANRAL